MKFVRANIVLVSSKGGHLVAYFPNGDGCSGVCNFV